MSMFSKIKAILLSTFLCFSGAFAMIDQEDNYSERRGSILRTSNVSENEDDTTLNESERRLSLNEVRDRGPISRSSLIEPQTSMNSMPVMGNSFADNEPKVFMQLNDAVIDFEPLIRAQGLTSQSSNFIESFNFLVHNYMTPADVHVAQMVAMSTDKQASIFDWVTNGWKCAKWAVGTSQNIATILIAVGGIAANFFKDKAVMLATASAIVAAGGTLLSLVYDYCDKKRLYRIARNLVIMAIQAAREEEKQNRSELTTI